MRLKHLFYDLFFLFIVILSVAEVFSLFPGDILFFKKLLSWLIVGVGLYYVSLTRILFNQRYKKVDLILVLALFLFAYKNLVHSVDEIQYLEPIRQHFIHNVEFSEILFNVGSALLVIMSIVCGWSLHYEPNSLLGLIRIKGHRLIDKILDTIIVYIILMFFSYFIFAVVMEWFAAAIDSYVIIAGLVYYFVVYYVLHTDKGYKSFAKIVLEAGERFIKTFLSLFHDRATVFFGISGVIVMHSAMDIVNYLLPYAMNLKNSYISSLVDSTHKTLFDLIAVNIASGSILETISVIILYVMNLIFMFFILLLPFYIWTRMFNKKEIRFSKIQVSLFFSCFIAFLLSPAFRLESLRGMFQQGALTGVDIVTQNISTDNCIIYALISLVWFLIIYLLSKINNIKQKIDVLLLATTLICLGDYIFKFYSSTLVYFLENINFLFRSSKYLLVFYLSVYLVLITLFYICGYILFVFEVLHSEHISFLRMKLENQKHILLAWSITMFVLFLYLLNTDNLLTIIIMMISSFLLSLVLFRYEHGPAKFMLAVNFVLASFLMVYIVIEYAQIGVALSELVSRIALAGFAIFVSLQLKGGFSYTPKRLGIAILAGVFFGFWFRIVEEPMPVILNSGFLFVFFFSILVALSEELIFRYVLLRYTANLYTYRLAVIIQAVIFALMHLMNFMTFWYTLGPLMLLTLFLSLIVFGVAMGELTKKGELPVYAIICHTITLLSTL